MILVNGLNDRKSQLWCKFRWHQIMGWSWINQHRSWVSTNWSLTLKHSRCTRHPLLSHRSWHTNNFFTFRNHLRFHLHYQRCRLLWIFSRWPQTFFSQMLWLMTIIAQSFLLVLCLIFVGEFVACSYDVLCFWTWKLLEPFALSNFFFFAWIFTGYINFFFLSLTRHF
jgi:hypothetical protein